MTLCRHFGTCGGCAFQDMAPDAYRAMKREEAVEALKRHGFDTADVAEIVSVPPRSRRRASFKAKKKNGATEIGFHAARSHAIVDMHECLVLTPTLFSAVTGLRAMLHAILRENEAAELHVTETDAGLDLAIKWQRKLRPDAAAQFAPWAKRLGIARITAGNDIVLQLAPPRLCLGPAKVALPPGAFLQPTREGEGALQSRLLQLLDGARRVADLFAGCGTFALPLARRAAVHAVDADRPMLAALADAARSTPGLKPVSTAARDLFKRPLAPAELNPFDAVLLDPPRAGAKEQAAQIARSKLRCVAYVSCNAQSFARDARLLADAGFTLGPVTPVDQFLWSAHIELVAGLSRP